MNFSRLSWQSKMDDPSLIHPDSPTPVPDEYSNNTATQMSADTHLLPSDLQLTNIPPIVESGAVSWTTRHPAFLLSAIQHSPLIIVEQGNKGPDWQIMSGGLPFVQNSSPVRPDAPASRQKILQPYNTPSEHLVTQTRFKMVRSPTQPFANNRQPQAIRRSNTLATARPSVKHLTCWWWHEKGKCRYSEADCLYAHHETGLVADAPRQVKPGGPVLAGRSLDRALRQAHAEEVAQTQKTNTPEALHEKEKRGLQRENQTLRTVYEILFSAVCRSMDAKLEFRKEFNTLLRAVLSVNDIADSDLAKADHSAALVSPGTTNARNLVRIDVLAAVLREIEQKALLSATAEWHIRAEISQVESLLTASGMGDLVVSARKLAEEPSDE